jgi:hypothetical protein
MEWSVSEKVQVLGEALESVGIGWPMCIVSTRLAEVNEDFTNKPIGVTHRTGDWRG